MAAKCTGAEIKRFSNDLSFWPEDGPDAPYYDDGVILVNGSIDDDFDYESVDPRPEERGFPRIFINVFQGAAVKDWLLSPLFLITAMLAGWALSFLFSSPRPKVEAEAQTKTQ